MKCQNLFSGKTNVSKCGLRKNLYPERSGLKINHPVQSSPLKLYSY